MLALLVIGLTTCAFAFLLYWELEYQYMTYKKLKRHLQAIELKVDRIEKKLQHMENQTQESLRISNQIFSELKDALEPVEASSIELFTIIDGQEQKVDKMNLKVTQMIPLIVKALDKKGNPAALDGAPTFAVDDATLAELVDVDGVKNLRPLGALGVVKISVDADGDLGEGVKALHFEAAVNIIAGDAETLDIEFGAPVDQP